MEFFRSGIGEIPGLFSWSHLIYILISLGSICLLLLLNKNKTNEQIKNNIKIISIIVIVLEILKIIWNLTLREVVSVNDYVPLYFCSFFIYVSAIFAFSKNTNSVLYKFSLLFLFYGGMSGGLAFALLPTTTLNVFPLLQV